MNLLKSLARKVKPCMAFRGEQETPEIVKNSFRLNQNNGGPYSHYSETRAESKSYLHFNSPKPVFYPVFAAKAQETSTF